MRRMKTSGLGPAGRVALLALLVALSVLTWAAAQEPPSFADVAVILEARCTMCHGGARPVLELQLESFEGLMAGSARGPVVVPGDPDASELVRRLRGESQPRMPLTGPPYLSDEEIDLFVRWIEAGAPPAAGTPDAPTPQRDDQPTQREPDFVTYADVQPLLLGRCGSCHTSQGVMGPAPEGYRLDSYQETLRPDDRARVVPFDPAASELIRRVLGQAQPRMPLGGPYLDDAEIELLVAWVRDGARDADGAPASLPVGTRVRLHGTWGPNDTLDGLALIVDAGTRIDDPLRVGDYVQVRGVLDADGRVRVERVRRR
jgi:mono/diheme cytochrome c family protein